MSEMTCPECRGWLHIEADGVAMSIYEFLHLPRAPQKVTRRIVHKVWCRTGYGRGETP